MNFKSLYEILVGLLLGNVCSIKFRSKPSTVLLLCILRNLLRQTLHGKEDDAKIGFYLNLYPGVRLIHVNSYHTQ